MSLADNSDGKNDDDAKPIIIETELNLTEEEKSRLIFHRFFY